MTPCDDEKTESPEPASEPDEPEEAPAAAAAAEAAAAERPDFVACDSFDGARDGYELKSGPEGQGYYSTDAAAPPPPAADAAGGAKWRDPDDEGFDLDSVPALSPEEIKVSEDVERERVSTISSLARTMTDGEVVSAIFEKYDADGDSRLNMVEYGLFLKAISYSKAWTQPQWEKECSLIGGDIKLGVALEHMTTLYTKYRAAKLRIDYANVNKLPGEEVRKLMDEVRRANGGNKNAAGQIAGDSQMLTAADMADSKLSPDEYKRMQGMLGGSTAKGTKVLAKLNGATEKLEKDSFDANQTLVLMGCTDCVIEVETTCVKVFLQMCTNVTLHLRSKVITHTLEAYKCDGCNVVISTKIWTAQMDLCKGCNLDFASREDFQTIVSAGCHDMGINLVDVEGEKGSVNVHYPTLAAAAKAAGTDDINEERSQFKTHFKGGKLATEHIVRLENGFPTTEDERKEFDRRQDFNMKKVRESLD